MGTRRFTPEYRRDVASLVLDTGLRSRLWLGIEGWVNRWWAGGSNSNVSGARPPNRGALIHARWKQKAQIAVAVITTLPQLIWAIAFLLSTLMGS